MIDHLLALTVVLIFVLLGFLIYSLYQQKRIDKRKVIHNVPTVFPAKICVFNTAPFDGLWGIPGKHNPANYIQLDIYTAATTRILSILDIASDLTEENTRLHDEISRLNTACAKLEAETMSIGCKKGGFELRITNAENHIKQALTETAANDTTSARCNAQLYIDGLEDAYNNITKWLKTEAKEFNSG